LSIVLESPEELDELLWWRDRIYGALALDAWNKGGIVARAKPARTKTNGLICLELLIEEKRGPVQPTRSHVRRPWVRKNTR
jgi:hypothetical protein